MTETKSLTASDLNKKFDESKSQLHEHLAETRTNNNLFQGNHFQKSKQKLARTLENASAPEDVKIRIVKNHTNTVCKYIINSILHQAPTGVIAPKNPNEIQDQKAAEIHKVIFEDYKYRNKLSAQIRSWVHDYVVSGEVALNVFWDNNKGSRLVQPAGYDEFNNPVPETTYFEGDAVCERIFVWDLRHDGAKSMDEATWIGYEKMVDPDVIRATFGGHPDLEQAIQADMDDTYKVFEASSGSYKEAKNKVRLRQIYYRPCITYPNGQYVFFTKDIILGQGDLPMDNSGNVIFPIKYLGFDEIPTSARSASIIRQIRPEQMEVNRCASEMAITQMTVGHDKLIVPTGGTVEAGATKSGVRIFRVPGGKQAADFIPGRSGEQFLATMQQNISEIYNKTGVPERWDEKQNDTDIMATLYKNMRQKTRFSLYSEKFSEFLVDVIETILRLKKTYMLDESFFRVTGKAEYQNIAEFRSADDLGYQIKVEPGTEDLESRFGRFVQSTQILQYVGQNLDDNARGMIIKSLPFANNEEISSKMTMNYDNAKNIMLALDRGESVEISQLGDPLYIAEQLNTRMFKPDFRYLNPVIQNMYRQQVQAYNQIYTQKAAEVQRAEAGFIPNDGPKVPIDGMYEEVITSSGLPKSQRVQMTQSSLMWLQKQLQLQDSTLGNFKTLPLEHQAQIANQLTGMQPQEQAMPAMPMGAFPQTA